MRVVIDRSRHCLGFPTLACAPYAADYDGDEVQLYVVTNKESVAECEMWMGTVARGYSIQKLKAEHEAIAGRTMNRRLSQRYIMDNATTTLRQVLDRTCSLTESQKSSELKDSHRHAFESMKGFRRSVRDRFKDCRSVMVMKIGKQERQGDIGYMCRRARTCAANYHNGVMSAPVECGDERLVVSPRRTYDFGDDDYGNESIRAKSMLCKTVMQEMLTTKSGQYNESVVSPMHCYLTGEGKSIMILKRPTLPGTEPADDAMKCVCVEDKQGGICKISAMMREGFELEMSHCSGTIAGLSLCSQDVRRVCENAVDFIMVCARIEITARERSLLVSMAVDSVTRDRPGLLMNTRGTDTEGMRWLYACHSIYYSTAHPCFRECLGLRLRPTTLPEQILTCNHSTERSLAWVIPPR